MKKGGRQTVILVPSEQIVAAGDSVRVLDEIINGINIE